MRSSLLSACGVAPKIGKQVKRSSLEMYDLFRLVDGKGSIFMHTGQRTRPPSGGKTNVVVSINGEAVIDEDADHYETLFVNKAGKDVIGFQSVKVRGKIKANEDGTYVTYSDKQVVYEGTAAIALPSHLL